MEWYYAQGDQQLGPLSRAELLSRRAAGQIHEGTLVWRRGMDDWVPFGEIEGGISAPSEAPPLPSVVSARLEGHESLQPRLRYAGFWIRFVAYFLDIIALFVIFTLLYLVLGIVSPGLELTYQRSPDLQAQSLNFLIQFVGGALYATFFLGKYGATPGKMAVGIQVVRADGSRISYRRALCRYLAECLSALILYIGYIMAAFDSQKRTLHDRICETRVVYESD